MDRLHPHPHSGAFRYVNLYQHSLSDREVLPGVVLVVELARKSKRNALNVRLWKEIGQVFGEIGRTKHFAHVRSVLLVGQGKAFCAGIDITDMRFFPATPDLQRLRGSNDEVTSNNTTDVAIVGLQFLPLLREMQACFTALEQCPVPIVTAIHGSCIGAGIDLVTAADVRLATSECVFSVREVALGLAADVGTLQRLPKICGNQAWVRSLCLTGRNFDGKEALQQGFVTGKLYETPEEVWQAGLELCEAIAQHNPVAVRGTKQALLYARDHSVAEGLEQIAAYNMLALQSPQMVLGIQASWTGQKFRYVDLPPSSRL